MKTHIRWMVKHDNHEVLEIERACFGDFAWSQQDFTDTLRNRNTIAMVAVCEKSDAVLGYMIYALHKGKLELLNLAVDPAHFRQGIGRALIAKLTGKLTANRRTRVSTVVRESNLGAQLFLKAVGFRAQVPILKEHYDDTKDDAYRFVYRHGQANQPNRESVEKLSA